MKAIKRFRLPIIFIIVVGCIVAYVAYIYFHYYAFEAYKSELSKYNYEKGSSFTPLKDSKPEIDGMVLAAENDILKLYTNTKTTEIAIYDKRSGQIIYSNPVGRENDQIANSVNKVALNSQFTVTYYDSNMTESTMYNYDSSVTKGQFKIESIKNGIRYIYLLGNLDSPTGIVPVYITEERLNEVLSKLNENDADIIRYNYIKSKSLNGFLELTTGALNNKIGMQKMNSLFEKAGYTKEDFDADNKAAIKAGAKMEERTTFSIPLEYRLDGDKLIVSIPTGKIVETGSGKIAKIDLLNYFDAGNMNEKGYIFVPNGSGSLIYFNNGKKVEEYRQDVYGEDDATKAYDAVEKTQKARLPVFGIKHDRSAVFAEITNGDALATIVAGVSGNINSYNYVYPSFTLRGTEKVSMFGATGASADLPSVEKNMYNLDINVSYAFLNDDDADYSGMANYYRNELINRKVLNKKQDNKSIPFYLDIVGGVKIQKNILGIPHMEVFPMTTFKEAGIMIDDFIKNGVSNIKANYLGWFNGGYYHDVATKINVVKSLGGRNGLEELNSKLKASGQTLFGDVAFQKISYEAKNFNWKMEASRYYSGYVVSFGLPNPATMRETGGLGYYENNYYILSPKFLIRHVSQFDNAIKSIDISGISLRDLGDTLSSDKRRTDVIDRQEAEEIVINQIKDLSQIKKDIMIQGGNMYSLAYATDLENVPSVDNKFYIVDEEVPFYEMVVHGYVNYTDTPINLNGSYDKQETILHLIEYGLSPRFTLSYKDSSEMKYSSLNYFYSTQYNIWIKDASDIYKKVNDVLKYVANSSIVDYQSVWPGVNKISYENGYTIYVNHNEENVNIDGINIVGKSYVLEGAKQ